jgi:hypothetical protein
MHNQIATNISGLSGNLVLLIGNIANGPGVIYTINYRRKRGKER